MNKRFASRAAVSGVGMGEVFSRASSALASSFRVCAVFVAGGAPDTSTEEASEAASYSESCK